LEGCPICRLYSYSSDSHRLCFDEWSNLNRVTISVFRAHRDAVLIDGYPYEPNDHIRDAFVKIELGTGKALVGNFDGYANRLIQGVSARTHIHTGPQFYAISKFMASYWCDTYPICYASQLSVLQAGAYVSGYSTWYVGDVSRFDRSVHYLHLDTLSQWRRTCLPMCDKAYEAIEQQTIAKGKTMVGRHKYHVLGQRKSGDDNTSIDNSILNAAMHIWVMCTHFNWTIDDYLHSGYRTIVLGDDIVICGDGKLTSVGFGTELSKIGWTPKPKIVTNINDVEFCSRMAWPTRYGRCFGAKPGRLLSRFGFCAYEKSPVGPGEKAYGVLYSNRHVPFVREYLERVLAIYPTKTSFKFNEWAMHYDGPELDYTDETWEMLYYLYGLTKNDVDNFRVWLMRWAGGPAIGQHYTVTKLFEVEGIM
jgi:hypothetical protein